MESGKEPLFVWWCIEGQEILSSIDSNFARRSVCPGSAQRARQQQARVSQGGGRRQGPEPGRLIAGEVVVAAKCHQSLGVGARCFSPRQLASCEHASNERDDRRRGKLAALRVERLSAAHAPKNRRTASELSSSYVRQANPSAGESTGAPPGAAPPEVVCAMSAQDVTVLTGRG